MIVFDKLRAGYSGRSITPTLSGTLPTGSLTAITGDNGCGKSTLLKTLAGLLPPSSGDFQLNSREIALLPQQQSLDRNFPVTVNDIVKMGCWQQRTWYGRLPKDLQRKVAQALAITDITSIAKLPLSHLSGGQLQRALFSRMWLQPSDIWLLDEPFTGVDEATTRQLMSLTQQMVSQGKTIVMVLHDEDLVQRYCDIQIRLTADQAHWVSPIIPYSQPRVRVL